MTDAVHLLGVGKIVDVDCHCFMEVWMIRVEQRLKDTMAGGWIDFINSSCWYQFSHNVGDKLQQPLVESWVLFGLLSHLFRGCDTLDPNLCTHTSTTIYEGQQ